MVGLLVVLSVIAGAIVFFGLRRLSRTSRFRRNAATMFVTTYPGIELDQSYGAWDADPYDACGVPAAVITPLHVQPGMPSRWGRLF